MDDVWTRVDLLVLIQSKECSQKNFFGSVFIPHRLNLIPLVLLKHNILRKCSVKLMPSLFCFILF